MLRQISGIEKKHCELLAKLFYQTTCWSSPNYYDICLAVAFFTLHLDETNYVQGMNQRLALW